jgi:hypothetical protein
MSTDFHDPDLDELLSRHGQDWQRGFTAPPLDGMLSVATSGPDHRGRRWLAPIAAAVLLLAIPLITVLALRDRPEPAPPAKPAVLKLIGAVAWADAVLQTDGKTVSVTEKSFRIAKCDQGIPVLRASVVSETASQVVIAATAYESSQRPAADSSICKLGGTRHARERAVVSLSTALGKRVLIDAKDGSKHPVLTENTLPRAGYVPGSFRHAGVSWNEETGTAQRFYTNSKGFFTISRELYPESGHPFEMSDFGSEPVHGHLAKYQNWGGNWHVSWIEGKYLWTVNQMPYNGAPIVQLDRATLFKIARSLRW